MAQPTKPLIELKDLLDRPQNDVVFAMVVRDNANTELYTRGGIQISDDGGAGAAAGDAAGNAAGAAAAAAPGRHIIIQTLGGPVKISF